MFILMDTKAPELDPKTIWSTFLSPGDVDYLQLVKSWIPWLNFDNKDCRDVPVDSVQEHEQKIKSSSSLPTKPKEGDGVLAGGLQLEGKLNSRSSPEASLHPELKGSDSLIATAHELEPEPRLSISDNSKPEVGEVGSIHVTDLERTVLRSSASVNLMPQDGGPQIKCASELDGLIRAGASLDSKPNSAGVAITIVPEPQERNSKSNASEYPKSTGGESETTFVSDSDTGCTRKSHHHLAIFISWFFGIAFLILWNSILNAGDYFYSVFPEYHPSRVFPLLYIPEALVMNTCWFLVLSQAQHNIRLRVLGGFAIFFVAAIFIILVSAGNGFAVLGSRSTFEAMCAIFLLSSIGEGICGGVLFGEFSFMDPVYLQALNAGIAASGIATTGLRMITKYIFGDTSDGLRNGAMSFFAISAFVHLVAIILYAFVFPRLEGVRKYRLKAVAEGSKKFRNAIVDDFKPAEEESDGKVHSEKRERQWSKAELLYESWDYVTEIIILYAVIFSIIPGFLYENIPSNNLGTWYPLVLLALFGGADFLSRIVRIERLFMRSRRALRVCSGCLVLLFIPGFYFGAMYTGAWLMMLLCGLLGTTSGYFTVCIFDNAPLGFKISLIILTYQASFYNLGWVVAGLFLPFISGTGFNVGYVLQSPEQSTIGTMLYLATLLGVTIGLATNWFWLLGSTR